MIGFGWAVTAWQFVKRWWPALLALAVLLAAGLVYWAGRRAGFSEAQLDGLKRTVERSALAVRAKATVKPDDKEAMGNDPFNRDRRGR